MTMRKEKTKHPNRLVGETSPYLLQHAHNPVDWRPWSEEAFEEARAGDRMVLVSIGYSACHWCHVMERESFENEQVAALMNEYFVNIKIDREERPDLDHIYMDAVQAMTGSGGWPLNVFLTPDKKPFYGGTYFPPVQAFNRPSWTEVLNGLARAWKERRTEILDQAEQLTGHLFRSSTLRFDSYRNKEDSGLTPESCRKIFEGLMQQADRENGGFGRAPKFPQTFMIGYLLRYYHHTQTEEALNQALLSLDALLNGGIYDHVGGGLARYSTDEEWLAPHFEKMLYDNALLLHVLTDAFQLTRKEAYRDAIGHLVGFVRDEMTGPEGGFYSALDADSEGVEGKYYTWSLQEVNEVLSGLDDSAAIDLFCRFFDISEAGNWEGVNILRKKTDLPAFAASEGMHTERASEIISAGLKLLAARRKNRIRPGLDDKAILGWNALMASALARAGAATGDAEYVRMAEQNIGFIESNFPSNDTSGGFLHTWKNGQAKYPAFLDDYACLAEACLRLHEATMDDRYLTRSREICAQTLDRFSDEENRWFYFTASSQRDVLVRKKEIYDGAMPSPNAIMAVNLWKLGMIFGIREWQKRAVAMLSGLLELIEKHPTSFGRWAMFGLQQAFGIVEIALLGIGAKEAAKQINERYYMPEKCMQAAPKSSSDWPLLAGKKDDDELAIYVCRDFVCLSPVNSLAGFEEILSRTSTYVQ